LSSPGHTPDSSGQCRITTKVELWISVLILVSVTSAVYSPIVSHRFTDWDDKKLMIAVWPPGWERAWAIVTDFDLKRSGEIYYTPVSLLSLMYDQLLVGARDSPQPWIAKLMNATYHVANTLLVFALLTTIGLGRRPALIGAFVFAIHPVQVGTVAWVSERKNLLAVLFYVSSIIVYLRYLACGKTLQLVGVAVLFGAGLLSKPSAVTLPVALLALVLMVADRSINWKRQIPFFVLLFAMSLAWGGYVMSTERTSSWILPSWPYRPLIAAAAIWFYISKFMFPVNLAPLYPKWDVAAHVEWFSLLLLAFLAAAALIIHFRKRVDRWVLYGLFFFLLNLSLVVGLVPFGYMGHSFVADHFMYLPLVGLALVIARIVDALLREISIDSLPGKLLIIAVYVWLCALGVASVKQTWLWRNPAAMWEATLKLNQTSPAVYNNYGVIKLAEGNYDTALSMFRRAAKLAPNFDKPYHNMGEAYRTKGDSERARKMHAKALRLNPRNTNSALTLGKMLREDGKPQEAIEFLKKAIAGNPHASEIRDELGVVYHSVGRVDEAWLEFEKAITLHPLNANAHVHKGIILLAQGKTDSAIRVALKALRYSNIPQAHNLLGACYASKGDLPRALSEFLVAYKMQPALPRVRDNTANLLMDLGRSADAEAFCREAAQSGHPCDDSTLKRVRANIGSGDRIFGR